MDDEIDSALALLIGKRRTTGPRRKVGKPFTAHSIKIQSRERARKQSTLPKHAAPVGRIGGLTRWQVLIARMDPGRWYTSIEMSRLVPEWRIKVARKAAELEAPDCLEITENPEHDPDARTITPRWLFRLAAAATGRRAEWRRALGMSDGPSED